MVPDQLNLFLCSKRIAILIKSFEQRMDISSECFGGFWEIVADSGTGFVKPPYLPAKHSDLLFIKPFWHPFIYPNRIVKNYPDIFFALFRAECIYPVVLEQRFANNIFKRVEEVVGQGMDKPVILLEMVEVQVYPLRCYQ